MADASSTPSSATDSELNTNSESRKENVGLLGNSSYNEHNTSKKTKRIQKRGKNNEKIGESSYVSQEQPGSSTSSREQKSSFKSTESHLDSRKEGTDTEEDYSEQQTSTRKSKVHSAHNQRNKTSAQMGQDDRNKKKGNNILLKNKKDYKANHESKDCTNRPYSKSTIEENVSSKSISEDMDDDSTANESHDSSLTDNDNENLADAVVDTRVIKKFSYLAAALKETKHNLRAMDDILSEQKRMKELSKLTAEQVRELFNQNNQNGEELLKSDDGKVDENKLNDILHLLENLTKTVRSYEQNQMQAAGGEQDQQMDMQKMKPRNNPSAENMQILKSKDFTDNIINVSEFNGIPQIKCGDSENYKTYYQSETPEQIQKGKLHIFQPNENKNSPVVLKYGENNSSTNGSHNFLAVPESPHRNSQYQSDENMQEVSASDINLISGHNSSYFDTNFLNDSNLHSSQSRCGNFILGSFESFQNNEVNSNLPNNVKYPYNLIENTQTLRKDIDNIEERKKKLDDRIQMLIAQRAEEASNQNTSHDDRTLKTRINRYKKKSRNNKSVDDQTGGSSFQDSYISMISDDRNEFPSLQMSSLEHEDKISELRNDEADLPGLGDSGLSSEINSLNNTIQVLIKENQQLHTFLQTSYVEAKEKTDTEKQDLENKIKILSGENESLKLTIASSGNFSLIDVSSATKNDIQSDSFGGSVAESRDLEEKVNKKLQDDLEKWEAALLDDFRKLSCINEETIPEEKEEDLNYSSKNSTPRYVDHSKQYDMVDLENLKNIELNELQSKNSLLEMKVIELTELYETSKLQLTGEKQTAEIKINKVQIELKNVIEENELLQRYKEKLSNLDSEHSKSRDKIHELSVINLREKEKQQEELSNLNCEISRIKVENENLIHQRHLINVELEELKERKVDKALNKEKICVQKGTNTSNLLEEETHEIPSHLGDGNLQEKICVEKGTNTSNLLEEQAHVINSHLIDGNLQEKIQTLINQNETLAKQLSEIKVSNENSEEGMELAITKVLEKHQTLLSNVNHEMSSPNSSDHSLCQTNIDKLSREKKDLMSAIQVIEVKLESLEVQKKLLEERVSEKKTICHNECCETIEKFTKEREDLLSALELTEKKVDALGKQNDTLKRRLQLTRSSTISKERDSMEDKKTDNPVSEKVASLESRVNETENTTGDDMPVLVDNSGLLEGMGQSSASREENNFSGIDLPNIEISQTDKRNEGLLDITFRREKENWAQLLQQTENEKKNLEKRLKELVLENNCLADRLEELMGVSRSLTKQLKEVKGTLTKCTSENVQLHKKIKSLEESREESSLSISDSATSSRLTQRFKERIRHLQGEVENAWQEVHQRTIERDRVKAERESLQCTSDITLNTAKIEIETLKAEKRAIQEDCDSKGSQLMTSRCELQNKMAELHGVLQDLAQQQERNKEMENGITRMNRELKESEEKITKLSLESKQIEVECSESQVKLRETRQQLKEEMKEKELSESKIRELESRVHIFQASVVATSATEALETSSNVNDNDNTNRSIYNERHLQDTINRLKARIHHEQMRCRLLEATEQENTCKILELQRGLREAVENHESIQSKYKKIRLAYQTKKQLRLEQLEQAKQYSTQIQELAKTSTALEESYKVMLSSLGENVDITVEILTSHIFLSPCVVHPSTDLHSDSQLWFANQQAKLRWLQTQLRKLCLHNWKTDLLPPTTNQGTDKGVCNRYIRRSLNELSILEGTRSCSSTPRKKNSYSSGAPKLRKVSSFDSGLEMKGKSNKIISDDSNVSHNNIVPQATSNSNISKLSNVFLSNSHCSLNEAERSLTQQQKQLSEAKYLQYKALMKSLQSELSQPLLGSPSIPSSIITTPEKRVSYNRILLEEDYNEESEFQISITDSKVTASSKESGHENFLDSDKDQDSLERTTESSNRNEKSEESRNDEHSIVSLNTIASTNRSDLIYNFVQSESEK